MSKNKDAAAIPAIFDYLNRQNRPYSAVDILNNLHKEHGKTAVVKALDTLVAEGKIKMKTYNKQTVYCSDQSQYAEVDESVLKAMEAKSNAVAAKLKESSDCLRQLDSELHGLNSAITTEDARSQLVQLNKECLQYADKLRSIKSNVNAVSPVERQAILKSRTFYVKEWRKRKRMGTDIVNAILEGCPKSKRELLEEMGVETDEDVGVKVPDG